MLVSIITPSFNRVNLIEGCIHSIRDQTYSNIEHIVVDGGSTDGTIEVLKKYPNIKCISEPDRGMYDAINKGINLARGEIIAYLNTDDRYYSDTVSTVVEALGSSTDIDFVYGDCTYIDSDELPMYTFHSIPYIRSIIENMGRIPWAQQTCFWRKSVHEKIGAFDADLKYCGDYDFFMRMVLAKYRGKYLKKVRAKYMVHESGFSVNEIDKMHQEYMEVNRVKGYKYNACIRFLGEIIFKLTNITNYHNKLRHALKGKPVL